MKLRYSTVTVISKLSLILIDNPQSNTKGPVNSLLYIIDLVLDNNGVHETLQFTATHAELEDLVSSLKDACNSVKRVSSS